MGPETNRRGLIDQDVYYLGLGMGALFLSSGVMGDVMPCADLPLFLMSGAFLRISSLPPWLYPLKYASHFYYGMDALSNIYWRQIEHIDCPLNSTTLCLPDGGAVLAEAGYSADFVYQDSLGLAIVTAVWSLIGYCGLRREESKGYAYYKLFYLNPGRSQKRKGQSKETYYKMF